MAWEKREYSEVVCCEDSSATRKCQAPGQKCRASSRVVPVQTDLELPPPPPGVLIFPARLDTRGERCHPVVPCLDSWPTKSVKERWLAHRCFVTR